MLVPFFILPFLSWLYKTKSPAVDSRAFFGVNTLLRYVWHFPGQYFLSLKFLSSYIQLHTGRPVAALHGCAMEISVSVLLVVCCKIIGCYFSVLNF